MGTTTEELYEKSFGISRDVLNFGRAVLAELTENFRKIDDDAEYNQACVVAAMQKEGVAEMHLSGTTGYGYNDEGRDTLERVYADIFHTEDALVRQQIVCGTQALNIALQANLRAGDEMLSPVGKPYDTMDEIIGLRPCPGSLADHGVTYTQVDLKEDGSFDYEGIRSAINDRTKLVEIQRSKGYSSRPSFTVSQVADLIRFIKSIRSDIICMVDNCYCEFVGREQIGDFGADMVVGSLIKNPGGGLAPCGGYIAGTKRCVEAASYQLYSPGLGREVGPTMDMNKLFYQGIFLAPIITAGALKGALFAARAYEKLGFSCFPSSGDERADIVEAIELKSPEAMIAFCTAIQAAAPVDSMAAPEPWDMPGYDDPVIMAAGAFVQGSSIELSADGPIRPPYTVYLQGGLTWEHAKLGVLMTLQKLKDSGIIRIS
ncbi:MAG: methionine gamma-lyase family protein [Lachnospiraceae bacterium]|jgi:cystathionine beta-lyase family protein involved in aluminum resistance|nr:methionine gamma-lyase family protein [Lachnospiraceae bacterium]MCH4030459.1 methionine gamma-lyase family protein [Lachnospiraceae bacterium]MCH4069669.1 methionine gamma-lyase family protein [Lachnospiraceae bacterium]MCH4107393.1 methionine gamma-lyase family protein [Lachnospiraceae bacterium]MCI1301753.1 methionine gamma-lyase family protein [Lachnospiraceae bacterium]